MPKSVSKTKSDPVVRSIRKGLSRYKKAHRDAAISVYRYNSVTVRIRVLDPEFRGMDRADRHELVWSTLEDLPEETLAEISILLPLTPKGAKTSFANMEYNHPVPSVLP